MPGSWINTRFNDESLSRKEPQVNEHTHLTPIAPPDLGSASTLLSWNGTCPESPDGTRLTYMRMARPAAEDEETLPADVWICTTDLTDHRKIFDLRLTCSGFEHNGAMAGWIDDRRLVLRSTEGGEQTIFVIDAETGEPLLAPVVGRLGHYPARHKIFFGITPDQVARNPAYPAIDAAGIYGLNCDTGAVSRIVTTSEILDFIRAEGYTPTDRTPGMFHVMPNPTATLMMARWDLQECESLICTDTDGGRKTLFPRKPLHQLWYDEATYYAVDRHDTGHIYRWRPDGTRLERLAGPGNHIDMSPDRQWFVTDSMYHRTPITISLFRRGGVEPTSVLDAHDFGTPTWALRAHANPVFSRDGARVYFVRPFSARQVQAVRVDLGGF
jgi:hypothetical protein